VQRNAVGQVVGHFANEQTFATERLPDDHPDLADYRQRRQASIKPSAAVHIVGTIRRSPFARGLLQVLAQHLKVSPDALLQQIIAEATEQDSPHVNDPDTVP
jgi:hypothetical protein